MQIKYSYIPGLLVLFVVAAQQLTMGQGRERIKYDAEILENGRRGEEKFTKLIDNVVFTFTNKPTVIYCDSAYFFKKISVMECFGHVRIEEGDSVEIISDKLIYEGGARMAKLRENVVYTDQSMKLYTDFLDYNTHNKQAHFFNSGRIVDEENELESESGYYEPGKQKTRFYQDVLMTHPDYKLNTDTLLYNMATKIANTEGPTYIVKRDGTVLYAEHGGEYNTALKQSKANLSIVESDKYALVGNKLYYDRVRGINKAIGDVIMVSKPNQVAIYGDIGIEFENKGITKVYGDPVLKKSFIFDTLFMAADTMISVKDSLGRDKLLKAYNNVRYYKSDLKGIADSCVYFIQDSMMVFYNDPVMWNAESQIEADTISIRMKKNAIDKLFLDQNAFMISQDTLKNFNQIKGRNMVGNFRNNNLSTLDVYGNSESIYYALESDTLVKGMNRILCSDMKFWFYKNKLEDASFYRNIEARFIPPHEIRDPETRIKGFNWRIEEKPTKKMVVSKKPEATKEQPEETTIEVEKSF